MGAGVRPRRKAAELAYPFTGDVIPVMLAVMIRSFGGRRTRRFFEGQRVAAFQRFAEQATRRLTLLDSAATLQDLAALPSNRLEALRGDRAGHHSIRINTQWRLCFRWEADGPYDIEIVDYH